MWIIFRKYLLQSNYQSHVSQNWNKKICNLYSNKKKTPNRQNNPEKTKLSQRNQVPQLQTILQGYSNENSMVLEHKQKYRSVEQHRKSRDKPMHLGTLIYDKEVNNTQWRKDSLLDKWYWENWTATCKRMKLEHSKYIHK